LEIVKISEQLGKHTLSLCNPDPGGGLDSVALASLLT